MSAEDKNQAVNRKLANEVHQQLSKRPIPPVEKKSKSGIQKLTLVMTFLMVLILVGSLVYAAVSGLGWM
ncbi:DUF4044 domain-containing protein [Leuconostocaceae bacterium ESL0723]|nr:DUF4044 domain-containing protein [Lactobacillaceae bacterium L1_55_11]WEV54086.1 DUF4044 domain-containing protein [Leuconostocaceae bacterium ESL0723]